MRIASQAVGRGFDPRLPLHSLSSVNPPNVGRKAPNPGCRPILTALSILLGIMLVPAFPSMGQAQGLKLPAGLFVGAQVADLWTTHAATTSGNGYEMNPIMGDGTGARPILIKAASTVTVLYLTRHLAKKGHPTAAKVMLYVGAGAIYTVAWRNAQIARGR